MSLQIVNDLNFYQRPETLSDSGGEAAAAIYTITETAKLNGVNPWAYLEQVLGRIQDHNAKKNRRITALES